MRHGENNEAAPSYSLYKGSKFSFLVEPAGCRKHKHEGKKMISNIGEHRIKKSRMFRSVGFVMVAKIRMKVDLPAPLGLSKPGIPGPTSSENSFFPKIHDDIAFQDL